MVLDYVILIGILLAVYPIVAFLAKSNDIIGVKSKFLVSGPRLDVMGMKCVGCLVRRATSNALVPVALERVPDELFPNPGSVKALSFRRTSINKMRVALPGSPTHPIAFPTQMWFFARCFFRKNPLCFLGVLSAAEWVYDILLHHIAIPVLEVKPTRARWDAKVHKFLIDVLRVSFNDFTNLVSGKSLSNVLQIQPIPVKVQRTHFHTPIIHPSMVAVK